MTIEKVFYLWGLDHLPTPTPHLRQHCRIAPSFPGIAHEDRQQMDQRIYSHPLTSIYSTFGKLLLTAGCFPWAFAHAVY